MLPLTRPDPNAARDFLIEAQERVGQARNYFAWQGRMVNREIGQRVVEVGCGVGNFTEHLLERQAVLAVDLDPESVDRVRRRFGSARNLETAVADAGSEAFAALAGFQPDSCVCLNVLEHIEDDETALRNMTGILQPGGVIALLVPAFQELYGPVDQNLGHFRRYRRRDIERLAERVGLRIRKAHYVNLPGFFAWWLDARIVRRQAHGVGQILLYDRLVIPVISRVESVLAPPFGQSLFAVLEKR